MKIKELRKLLNQFDDESDVLIFSQKEDTDRPLTKYDLDMNHDSQLVIDGEYYTHRRKNADN
jgi:diacylglycerol kinase family enzyme